MVDAIAERSLSLDKQMLLVFDNCAHVFTGVAQLTELLITETPLVHVVVSNRDVLCLTPVSRSP